MADSNFFELIRHLAGINDCLIAVDLDSRILSWDKGAERIFGYSKEETLDKDISIIFPKEIRHHILQIKEALKNKIPALNIKTKRLHKDGSIIDVNISFSPLYDDENKLMGYLNIISKTSEPADFDAVMQKMNRKEGISPQTDAASGGLNDKPKSDTDQRSNVNESPKNITLDDLRINDIKKRTFAEIRKLILLSIKSQVTINQLANFTGINWKTAENHLTFLIGKGLVKEILKSEYVRIVELTEEGRKYSEQLRKEYQEKGMEVTTS